MCGVPSVVSKALFDDLFKLRGVQDKILARLFYIFYMEITSDSAQAALAECVTDYQREEVANNILNKIAQLQINYENQDVPANHTTSDSELHGSTSGESD